MLQSWRSYGSQDGTRRPDSGRVGQGSPETIAAAETAFAEHFTAGRLAFRLDGPGRSTPIRQFEKSAPEILIVPAIQGG